MEQRTWHMLSAISIYKFAGGSVALLYPCVQHTRYDRCAVPYNACM